MLLYFTLSKTIHNFLTMALICISLIAKNVDHLFYVYLVPVSGQTAKQAPQYGWLTHKTVVYKEWRLNSFESWEAPAQGIGRHESTRPRFLWLCLVGADRGCLRPLSLMTALLLRPNTSEDLTSSHRLTWSLLTVNLTESGNNLRDTHSVCEGFQRGFGPGGRASLRVGGDF